MRPSLPAFVLLAAASSLPACAVDLGTTPDAGACAVSPDYFVSDVWPRYIEATSCGTASSCHDFSDGHGYFRLRLPESPAPAAGTAIASWPIGWRENYLAAIQLLDCQAPLASRLLTVPEGEGDLHPPGPVVRDRVTAATVLQTWVARGP